MPVDQGEQPSASRKGKRRDDRPTTPPPAPSQASKRRRKGPMAETSSTKPKSRTAARKQYHLKKWEIPEDATRMKAAFETHIRLISLTLVSDSVPEAPTEYQKAMFDRLWADSNDLTAALHKARTFRGHSQAVDDALRDVRRRQVTESSNTTLNIARIPDHFIRQTFAILHSFGITAWRPDFYSTPTSHYNAALQSIAISTFEHIAVSHGYNHMGINIDCVRDAQLLHDIYLNFVWSHLRDLVLKEAKEAGSVAKASKLREAYRRRDRLTQKRAVWLSNNTYPDRVQALASEPEYRPKFQRAKPEPRKEHDNPIAESPISRRLPLGCPLDWFAPEYFNSLDVMYRAYYIDAPIALPLAGDLSDNIGEWKAWKDLSDADFMARYGNKVKAQYNLPTEAEMAAMEDRGNPEPSSSSGAGTSANPSDAQGRGLSGGESSSTAGLSGQMMEGIDGAD
ncbi:hypothetical protein PLEOSDRAFT_152217 [Pleurotus ostreatus PC15]|uniref:Uncharacterized protein n=1 Tax=Pleurotus ostreatus (strain PC15) TaxID=1137138 RepID=A0A067P1F5_PLEO1|nr:hypothetical protein PLEOSDRAFT_152217 [Pleurotus ostreatus PC15]